MHRINQYSTIDEVLVAVKQNAKSLLYAADALRNNTSFFWHIWNIQKSEKNDHYRKVYIKRYLITEIAKTLIGASLTIASGSLLSGIITLPFPVLLILIAAKVVGSIYTFNKVAKHAVAFLKPKKSFQCPRLKM